MINYRWNLSDLKDNSKTQPTVFSCFGGGGGSSMGYKLAGFNVLGCNEIDERQMKLYDRNLSPQFKFLEDIRTFRNRPDLPTELFNLDILDSSFPCSLFSRANPKGDSKKGKVVEFREGQIKQTLDDLAFETISLVSRLRPKIIIFEKCTRAVRCQ